MNKSNPLRRDELGGECDELQGVPDLHVLAESGLEGGVEDALPSERLVGEFRKGQGRYSDPPLGRAGDILGECDAGFVVLCADTHGVVDGKLCVFPAQERGGEVLVNEVF
jgi:hypothetical protein